MDVCLSGRHLVPSNFGRLMCKRVEKASLGTPIKVKKRVAAAATAFFNYVLGILTRQLLLVISVTPNIRHIWAFFRREKLGAKRKRPESNLN